jgi:hypothetical protein
MLCHLPLKGQADAEASKTDVVLLAAKLKPLGRFEVDAK